MIPGRLRPRSLAAPARILLGGGAVRSSEGLPSGFPPLCRSNALVECEARHRRGTRSRNGRPPSRPDRSAAGQAGTRDRFSGRPALRAGLGDPPIMIRGASFRGFRSGCPRSSQRAGGTWLQDSAGSMAVVGSSRGRRSPGPSSGRSETDDGLVHLEAALGAVPSDHAPEGGAMGSGGFREVSVALGGALGESPGQGIAGANSGVPARSHPRFRLSTCCAMSFLCSCCFWSV
jgi:hypothetical protein